MPLAWGSRLLKVVFLIECAVNNSKTNVIPYIRIKNEQTICCSVDGIGF